MATVADGRIVAVDAYINKAGDFAQPVLAYLRDVMHAGAPGVVEAMKWSMPFFVYKGVILGEHGCVQGALQFRVVGTGCCGDVAGGRRGAGWEHGVVWEDHVGERFAVTCEADWVRETCREVYRRRGSDQGVVSAKGGEGRGGGSGGAGCGLEEDKAVAKKFEAMTPGCRREYCQWIAEAKREETREKRVATAVEWIAEGKSRNWKYESCGEGEGVSRGAAISFAVVGERGDVVTSVSARGRGWGEDGGEDAIGTDGYACEGGREGVLRDDLGGSDAAACGTCGEASGGGLVDLQPVKDGVDGDGDEDAAKDREDGGEGGMPPMLDETAMAMGVVRDLGAMERATTWLPPRSRTMP